MIDQILNQDWSNPGELLKFLDKNAIKIGQGFFSVVYKIDDETIIKVNSGDYDFGYHRFIEYTKNNLFSCFPIIYELREIDGWYYVISEMLSKYVSDVPDPKELICLRDAMRKQAAKKDINYEEYQIDGEYILKIEYIIDAMKDFNYENCSIDVNTLNVMKRNDDWVLIDPITILKKS